MECEWNGKKNRKLKIKEQLLLPVSLIIRTDIQFRPGIFRMHGK